MMLTVFTPSYNRAHTLRRLYESLQRQTSDDFCWLIVDDGSTDDTRALVSKWIEDGILKIEYHYQENQGKSMAHNKGVSLTCTELFVCVDSDDYLSDNAVEEISKCWAKSKETDVGILAFKATEEKAVTSIRNCQDYTRTTLKKAYDKLGLIGDTMLIFRTEVIKRHRFPHFEGEKFVPESFLYDQIDQEGQLILLQKPLYFCEYLDGGYTSGMSRLLYNNPNGYLQYINQRLGLDDTAKQRFLDSIRYDAMMIAHKKKKVISSAVYPVYALIALPAGWLLFKKRYATFVDK